MSEYDRIACEYETLKANLSELIKQTKHDALVPICHNMTRNQAPIAYAPGTIDHTNQLLVLLGCNWFVERSFYQAQQIIERRLKWLDERKRMARQGMNNMQKWYHFTEQLAKENENLVEIVEDYNEDEEKKWREEHRKRVKEHKEKERLARLSDSAGKMSLAD